MSAEAPEREEQQTPLEAERRRRARLKLVAAACLTVAAVSLGALIWLFAPGKDPVAPVNVTSLSYLDGTLTVVEDRRLVMRPFRPVDGRPEIEFTVREQDAQYFDIAHLKSHSSVALPTRVYYERVGATYVARYKEDAPANSQSGS